MMNIFNFIMNQELCHLGCGGNGNNFQSQRQCQKSCRRHMPKTSVIEATSYNLVEEEDSSRPDFCQLPSERGPCRAIKPRFFFNTVRQKCERFMYGGCKGNSNNFQSFIECVETCNNPSQQTNKKKASKLEEHQQDVCSFNGRLFNVGDVLRLNGDQCTVCICASPPSLTCQDECI